VTVASGVGVGGVGGVEEVVGVDGVEEVVGVGGVEVSESPLLQPRSVIELRKSTPMIERAKRFSVIIDHFLHRGSDESWQNSWLRSP
jgi:hypothetical protein